MRPGCCSFLLCSYKYTHTFSYSLWQEFLDDGDDDSYHLWLSCASLYYVLIYIYYHLIFTTPLIRQSNINLSGVQWFVQGYPANGPTKGFVCLVFVFGPTGFETMFIGLRSLFFNLVIQRYLPSSLKSL